MTAKKTTSRAKPRTTRTRSQVTSDFDTIRSETENAETADPTTAAIASARASYVRNSTQGVTPESVVTKLSGLGLDLNRAIALVQEQLVAEVQKLEETREAVALEAAELKSLHGIDVAATNIGILVQDYEQKTKALEQEYTERQERLEAEQNASEKAFKDQQTEQIQTRAREKAEYEYRKAQERRYAEDQFNESLRTKERENLLKQETLVRSWEERANALTAKEQEFTNLKAQVDGFAVATKAEVDKHVAIATNSLKSSLTHQHEMAKKDLETQLTIANSRIADHVRVSAENQALIAKLQAQVETANSKIESIAKGAIDGASKMDAYSQFVAMNGKNQENGTSRAKA